MSDASENGAAIGRANGAAGAPSNGTATAVASDSKTEPGENLLLQVDALKKYFPITKGVILRTRIGEVKAVDGVSFTIRDRETLALVGESGCGKTTTGRCVIRAIEPTSGSVQFAAQEGQWVDVLAQKGEDLRRLRRQIQMIFQDPYSSLDPRMTLLQIVGEPLAAYGVKGRELEERVAQLLELVGLRPQYMRRYPHAFSGGQRQRIGIARALALQPKLIVADEPVSALDVSIQAQVLNLLKQLQSQLGLAYLFISHNLSVVEYIAHRVGVMYVGQLVELAETKELFGRPLHPYTEALMSAVPKPDPRVQKVRIVLEGEVADPANPPPGCYFHPRCPYAVDRCKTERPEFRDLGARDGGQHFVSCHRAEELTLRGVGTPNLPLTVVP
ncbi:MAG TPA: oligopeptide/dipeptide ABC transporter ATP-binding protein [Chloroflexota bacterium]|nr:oligopeptide/dipeptide ABC transporter ATP-binding protein [Chloroflexota bacterium]